MSSSRSNNSGFPLSIADLGVLLSAENIDLMEQIFQRYRRYSIPGEDPHRVKIQIINDYTGTTAEQITITDTHLTITHQTYEGSIDFKRYTSTLKLNGKHPLADLEYFLRLVYAYLGFQAGGFLLHSAGMVRQGRSYLFFGPSGSGKSTVANLSAQEQVLNDDLVMLLPGSDHWDAFSTPFWNQGRGINSHPQHAPLVGMYRLAKDRRNFLEPISAGEALADMMACIPVLSRSSVFSAGLIQRCSALLDQVSVYRLHFIPDSSFWDVIG